MDGQAVNADSGFSSSIHLLTNMEPLDAFLQEHSRRRNGADTSVFSSATRLSHPPLKSPRDFRLLHLNSELADGLLDCSLTIACLDDAPDYAALSYVWGVPREGRKITCNGCKVEVTDNLYAALCRLHKNRSGQSLWADAICINQQDVIEKNHQVHMMKDIYTKAQHVFAWLGEETQTTAVAWTFFDFLEVGFNERHVRLERDLNDTTQWTGPNLNPLGKDMPDSNAEVWEALRILLANPWFKRIWTYQEVVVARKITLYCGNYQMDWERFVGLLGWIHACGRSSFVQNLNENVLPTWEARTMYHKPYSSGSTLRDLSTSLIRTRYRDATDPRDKVYALFGVVGEDFLSLEQLYPDYSLPVRETYIATAKLCLLAHFELMALSAAGGHREKSDLPSWVPDWDCKSYTSLLVARRTDGRRSFSASGRSRANIKTSLDSTNALILRGAVICMIDCISDPRDLLNNMGPHKWLPTQSLYARMAKQVGLSDDYMGEPARVSYARTLSAGLAMNIHLDDNHRLCQGAKESHWRANLVWEAQGCHLPQPPQAAHELGEHTMNMLIGRQLFTSAKKDVIGLCPESARVGDIVCLLFGGEVTYVLRPIRNTVGRQLEKGVWISGHDFEFVGEAYTHGYMDGEYMRRAPEASMDFVLY